MPATSGATGQLGGPHASWLTDKLTSPQNLTPGAAVAAVPTPVSEAAGALADELLDIITSAAAWPKLEAAWDDVGKLWTNLARRARTPRRRSPRSSRPCSTCSSTWSRPAWSSSTTSCSGSWNGCAVPWSRFRTSSTSPLPFPAPLLDVAWDFMVESAGLDPDDIPLTWGSLGAVGAAFPTTLVYKMVTGHAPYGDGGLAGGAGGRGRRI